MEEQVIVSEPAEKKTHKTGKIIGICFLVLLAIVVLALLVIFIRHKIMLGNEKKMLKEHGFVNPVMIDDKRCMNVTQRGSDTPQHTFVVLAGLGMSDTSVTMEKMLSEFYTDNKIVYIDRAGYGFSDDCNIEQTNKNIVSDYRTALKNAGMEAPYILLAHSIGGAYATYWETNFPDEVEAVIFVDGSQLSADAFSDEEKSSPLRDAVDKFGCDIGIGRLLLRDYYYILPSNYSKEEQKLSDALSVRQLASKALLSESNLLYENASEAFNGIITNDIPKLYICSSWGIQTEDELLEYMAWIQEQQKLNHLKVSKEISRDKLPSVLEQYKQMREDELMPYIDKLGNCDFVCLGGDHMIYEQKPTECTAIISEFVGKLK